MKNDFNAEGVAPDRISRMSCEFFCESTARRSFLPGIYEAGAARCEANGENVQSRTLKRGFPALKANSGRRAKKVSTIPEVEGGFFHRSKRKGPRLRIGSRRSYSNRDDVLLLVGGINE